MTTTKTAKHTPGPWCIEMDDSQPFVCNAMNADSGYGTVFAGRVFTADGGIIALVQFSVPEHQAEYEANLNLIAAAPDLYAIVRAEYDAHGGFETLPIGYPPERAAAICAAIAKAKGQA